MEKIPFRKGNCWLNIDLQPDICEITGNRFFDRSLPELEGAEPQGEEVPADYKETKRANPQFDKGAADCTPDTSPKTVSR